ncbi:hypothetical protein GCM10011505_10410 [Tistrella bauzanensis]|uniref:Uncharacterized protein n=2 Tax=Tistrella bauzanensis TaxID=657419 RepID=A0ABQ1IB84_9PROT|nr:hypothetical protein [Tistrella bauzanensis]GGB30946.1 hypothetical protein GCM10011505_10410 [Tistrella bauzanensis]
MMRHHIAELDRRLAERWRQGRMQILAWNSYGVRLDLLMLSTSHLHDAIARDPFLMVGPRKFSYARMRRALQTLGLRPVTIELPFTPGVDLPEAAVDAAVRRYGCTEVQHRGIAGFEIRGIQKLDPMQAAQATAVLWSRVVRARQLLVRSGLDIDLVSQQSGDTLLLWSRQIGHKSDTTLFALLLLVLADATLDRMTEAEAVAEAQAAAARAAAIAAGLTPPPAPPTPAQQAAEDGLDPHHGSGLVAAFHVGSHVEMYPPEGDRPGTIPVAMGEAVRMIRQMLTIATDDQLLIGQFAAPLAEGPIRQGRIYRMVDTPRFISHAQGLLDRIEGEKMGGAALNRLVTYLTGDRLIEGVFTIKRYELDRPDGLPCRFFNAKCTLHRLNAPPVFLGLQNERIRRAPGTTTVYESPQPQPAMLWPDDPVSDAEPSASAG